MHPRTDARVGSRSRGLCSRRRTGSGSTPSDTFVVGDHEADVAMGRTIGADDAPRAHGSWTRRGGRARGVRGRRRARSGGRDGYHRRARPEGDLRWTSPRRASATERYLRTSADLLLRVRAECADDIAAAAARLAASFGAGGKLLICGNGGSAADAQHLATEFVSTLTLDHPRPSIPALALTTDTSLLTAVANDFGVEGVFARQVDALGRPDDVLLAISTSGNSANVLRAAERARAGDLVVIGLTGHDGGKLAPLADVAIVVPSTVTAHIQESHLAIEQLLALLVERELYPDPA